MTDTVTIRLSLHGRLADDLSRAVVPGRGFTATVSGSSEPALRKEDGYFVFNGLAPSLSPYTITLDALGYQRRTVQISLPTIDPVEVALPGEDDLIAVISGVDVANSRVSLDPVPFQPTIHAESQVFGPGAFSATLLDPLEGSSIQFANLSTVAGLAQGEVLRFVRSDNLIVEPGPYYRFAPDATLLVIHVAENTAGNPPLSDVALEIDRVNTLALVPVTIGGVVIHTVTLGATLLPLGPDRAIRAATNARGDAVFYYPSNSPITSLRVNLTKTGYVPATEVIPLTAGTRILHTVNLIRV